MGACYTVEAKFIFASTDKVHDFCQYITDTITDRYDSEAIFEDIPTDTPEGCFRVLTSKKADTDGDIWFADFDASYSWEAVMLNIFEKALAFCEDGSYVYIDIDCQEEWLRKEAGTVIYIG